MKAISEKQAVKQFATMMNKLIANPPTTASEAISAIVDQFRTLRVICERDTLRFEWGTDRPISMTGFADLRGNDDIEFEKVQRQWIGISRQIYNEDEDDDSLCLFANIYFDESVEDVPSGDGTEYELDELGEGLQELLTNAFVKELLNKQPFLINAYAGGVG